ncbi:phospho-N-acetylmuramoyl-pentapeptide-transferase [Parablautia intestinalis]|uniref:phospho-N-acetylmuramoyl-pentapeptide- transferase n=1 Tax=Parablautia intestinalis TaxID=2320100 RepID=UPI002412A9FB|nr:phospho-N-acetylmuramoyl-pentapeptide-transferase [Parablautia intestinalis]
MLHYLLKGNYPVIASIGLLAAFAGTCFFTAKCINLLPRDAGREFAHDGKLSAGKPRGAGIIFILVFVLSALLFAPLNLEIIIYLILTVVEMLTGYMDDASQRPWGELKKGLLDLMVAVILTFTFLNFNSSTIEIVTLGISVAIPEVLFGILTIALVWGSINVTNCSDGVDGLSGTLAIVTLGTFYLIDHIKGNHDEFTFLILMFIICILGYLWYNAAPSRLLMGDAGSRAMGIFISIVALKSKSPLMYIPAAIVFIFDGGLGLLKVGLIRVFKIHILKNVRTPLHDHVRKALGWSNTQTVFRYAIIQIVVSMAVVYLLLI